VFGVRPTIIRVTCQGCGWKQRLERRYVPGELFRLCICVNCELPLRIDLVEFQNRDVVSAT